MDLDAIKSKLNQLQSTTSTANNFWKPEPGKQIVRIVPYSHNKDNPFVELFFHYNLGQNKTYMSPMSFGRPDPVQEFADKLKSTGDKDEWIQGKRLEPKMRTFAPVIVRGQESEGVKFWGFGKTVYQELLGVIADPDYYIGDGDNQWELIDKVDMKFNRMIFYPENIFHSALLEKGDFTENYRKTQLVFS